VRADWLREKGILKAAKKADRIAAEGLIGVATSGTSAAVVEVNSETDFVGKNAEFQAAVSAIAGIALKNGGDPTKTLHATRAGWFRHGQRNAGQVSSPRSART
jgi:elongation factor Ts